jgi:hypothetical protein
MKKLIIKGLLEQLVIISSIIINNIIILISVLILFYKKINSPLNNELCISVT